MRSPIAAAKVPPLVPRSSVLRREIDYATPDGAQELARVIMKAWELAGHESVRAWAVPPAAGSNRWDVRINLIGGLPPGAQA